MSKLILIGRAPDWFLEQYLSGTVAVRVDEPGQEALLRCLDQEVIAIVARGSTLIDGAIMDRAPGLKVIGRTGVGFNTIDVAAATARRIPVLYTPGALSRAVAEHTLALILSAAKNLPVWHRRVLEGNWEERYRRTNLDLEGSTVGIVGFGSIGREVWTLLRPFRVQCLVTDPYLDPFPIDSEGLRRVDLEELLAASDIVTLHLPLDQTTQGLINPSTIGLLKPGAILVNTARGGLIQSNEMLYQALENGQLGFVALDTLIQEPPELEHPLYRHPRALFSAHVASRTGRAQRRMLESLGRDLHAVLGGGEPLLKNILNPEVIKGWGKPDTSGTIGR